MIKGIVSSNEERINKSIEAMKREFASLRAGRATPSLLDKVSATISAASTPTGAGL